MRKGISLSIVTLALLAIAYMVPSAYALEALSSGGSGGGGGGNATGLTFGATSINNSGTAPTTGQCLGLIGGVIAGTACSGGASSSTNITVANAGTTGTTSASLAKLTGAPSTAVVTATTDTSGAVGIVISGAGTTGSATIAVIGIQSCNFDGATTAGDYAQISSSVAGDCTDGGATYPTSGQVIGRILATIGSAGPANVDLTILGTLSALNGTNVTSGTVAAARIANPAGDVVGTYSATSVQGSHFANVAITSASSPYAPTATDREIACNATGGATTVTLPLANASHRLVELKKTDSSANACIFARQGSDTIDGATSVSITAQNASVAAYDSATSTWYVYGINQGTGDWIGASNANQVTSTHLSAALPVNQGGTSITTTAKGDLLYAPNANQIGSLADVATGQVLASGGVGAAPAYTATPAISGANLTATTVPTASLAVVQGNGTKVQLSTGTTTTNDCVKYDANGNTVDNGSGCGSGGTVTSVSGTANQVAVATGTTTPVISLVGPYTPATYTTHGVVLGEGTSSLAQVAVCAAGSIIYGQTSADPICSTLIYLNAMTTGDLVSASSSNTQSRIADVAVGQVLISGGVGVLPAWSATPTFSGANITSGTIPDAALVTAPVTSVTGTANQIGVTGTTTPTLALIGPYTPATYTAHGVLVGEGTSSIAALAACAAGTVVYGVASADPSCSTLVFPNAATTGDIFIGSATNTMGRLADVAVGQVLASGGVGTAPAYTPSPTLTSLTTTGNITDGGLTSGNCVQASTGGLLTTTAGACAAGNNPLYTHTVTEAAGAATLVVNSASVAAIDTNNISGNANITITTPAAAAMADGEEVYVDFLTSGTPYTVGFTGGSGSTLKTIVLGDSSTIGIPAACGTVPATGNAWYKFKYKTATTTLTLLACGIDPPPATLGVALGGTGAATLTAHGMLLGEGTSAVVAMAVCGAGSFPYGQAAADPICSTLLLPNAATTGDLLMATSTNTIASLADVATGQVLTSGGVGTAAAYSANPNVNSLSTGTNPNITAGTAGVLAATEGTAATGKASTDELYADSTNHAWTMKNNNGSALIVAGSAAALTSGQCVQGTTGGALLSTGSACGTSAFGTAMAVNSAMMTVGGL